MDPIPRQGSIHHSGWPLLLLNIVVIVQVVIVVVVVDMLFLVFHRLEVVGAYYFFSICHCTMSMTINNKQRTRSRLCN